MGELSRLHCLRCQHPVQPRAETAAQRAGFSFGDDGGGAITTQPVAGTIFDFSKAKAIGRDIDQLGDVGTRDLGGGYDHNWCLNGSNAALSLCASVSDPASGRAFELFTNEPGVQFYTGGYFSPAVIGKRRKPYCRFAGYTFETQKFPNTPNFGHFPSAVLRPAEVYDHRMLFRFPAALNRR